MSLENRQNQPDQPRPNHRRRYTAEAAAGGLLVGTAPAYASGLRIPGSGIVDKAVELITFLPSTDTRIIMGGLVVGAGGALIASAINRAKKQNGS